MPADEARADEQLPRETEADPPPANDPQPLQPPLIEWRPLLLEP
ncbi:hypothetical protein [Pseudomonas sp. SWRI81]|nr:hypothetical protein [Pseudomonas sp. SWRI81]